MALLPSYQQSDSTLQQSVLCQLSLLFPLESLKTSINGSKLVLSLSLLFSKVCCFNFLYKPGLPSINVWLITCYANLTSTYPLLGFLKFLECLEFGFREVVRGLVSPTPFMVGCEKYPAIIGGHKVQRGPLMSKRYMKVQDVHKGPRGT